MSEYGLSSRMRLDLLVNDFVHRALRTFLHVEDMARAIRLALERVDEMAGAVYNVGDEAQNLSKRQLCALIGARVPGARFDFGAAGQDPDRRDYAVSCAKIAALDFRARIGMAEGIDELARALGWA